MAYTGYKSLNSETVIVKEVKKSNKGTLALIFAALKLAAILAGCNLQDAKPTPEPTATEKNSKATEIPGEIPTPTLIPTPTPTERQLTPEEMEQEKIKNEVNVLKGYYDKYEDYYALYLIKEFYESGKLIKDDYFNEIELILGEFPPEIFASMDYYSSLLNGRMEEIDKDSFGWFLDALVSEAHIGYLHLSLFDYQEQRDRVEDGVKIVDKWIDDPSDENTKTFEELIVSEKLTDEEKVFLIRWLAGRTKYKDINRSGKIYSASSYVEDVIIDEENNYNFLQYMDMVQNNLFKRNNTPNSEKQQNDDEILQISSTNMDGEEVLIGYAKGRSL